MLSCFGNHFKPIRPYLFFSFLGTSLLAATPTFGEVDVIATKRTYFSKNRDNYFSRRFRPQMCAVSFALFSPAMKNEAKV